MSNMQFDRKSDSAFIVDPDRGVGYATIQAAINAAVSAGMTFGNPATIKINPKSTPYTENLTLYNGIELVGQSSSVGSAFNFPEIIGNHVLSYSGPTTFKTSNYAISGLNFKSTTASPIFTIAGGAGDEISFMAGFCYFKKEGAVTGPLISVDNPESLTQLVFDECQFRAEDAGASISMAATNSANVVCNFCGALLTGLAQFADVQGAILGIDSCYLAADNLLIYTASTGSVFVNQSSIGTDIGTILCDLRSSVPSAFLSTALIMNGAGPNVMLDLTSAPVASGVLARNCDFADASPGGTGKAVKAGAFKAFVHGSNTYDEPDVTTGTVLVDTGVAPVLVP